MHVVCKCRPKEVKDCNIVFINDGKTEKTASLPYIYYTALVDNWGHIREFENIMFGAGFRAEAFNRYKTCIATDKKTNMLFISDSNGNMLTQRIYKYTSY